VGVQRVGAHLDLLEGILEAMGPASLAYALEDRLDPFAATELGDKERHVRLTLRGRVRVEKERQPAFAAGEIGVSWRTSSMAADRRRRPIKHQGQTTSETISMVGMAIK
jgi:hypothetical protein